jgi:hypothetical protein
LRNLKLKASRSQPRWGGNIVHIPSSLLRIALVIAALVGIGAIAPARAGDGGADAGTVQSILNTICLDVSQSPCPQLPTVSQGVLELAGLLNTRPEAMRADVKVAGSALYAGNTLTQSPPALSSLTPLAFVGAATAGGQAVPTPIYDPRANSFFYAVMTPGDVGGVEQPVTLNLFYDYLLRTTPTFIAGQVVAKLSLPLVVLRPDGSELAVCGAAGCPASVATLTVKATCTGGAACLKGYVTGDFTGTGAQATYAAEDLGIGLGASYGKSVISTQPHASFAVQVPLVVTAANDAPYFNGFLNPITAAPAFSNDQIGHLTPVLGTGVSVGVAPYAAPLCSNPAGTACPAPPAPAPASTYGFCASFSNNFTSPIGKPAPAVAAYVQIGIDGETLVSTPVPPFSPGTTAASCPF